MLLVEQAWATPCKETNVQSRTMILSRERGREDSGVHRSAAAAADSKTFTREIALDAARAARAALDGREGRGECPIRAMFKPVAGVGPLMRWTMLAMGAIAYAMFFGTILYAIGFVGNFVVPKTIDSGATGPVGLSLFINAMLLSVFVVQHTVMARPVFKKWWTKIVPEPMERSIFVALASASLMLVFWQWRPVPIVVWSVESEILHAGLVGVSLAGWSIVFLSSFMIDHFDLFGLRQSMQGFLGRKRTPVVFKKAGFYRLVRHPLMTGFFIAFWATPEMTVGHLFFAVMTSAYIVLGTAIEERDLYASIGPAYARYAREVPAFIPGLYVRRGRGKA
jgi:protein-S-isoprenylcysteine O-methyltransferase Ste14